MLGYIIGLIISGLIIGALGRLAVPGPNPMGMLVTIAIGIVASLVAGLISYAIGLGAVLTFIVAIVIAALAVYGISGSRGRRAHL